MDWSKTIYNIIVVVVLLIVFIHFTIGLLLIVLLNGNIQWIPFVITAGIVILINCILFTFRFFTSKKRNLIVASISVLALSIALIQPIQYYLKNRIPTVGADVDVYQYIPFSTVDSVVKLEKQATVQLTESLPIIDGATAFYPLYAAVAEALYPEKEYNPYDSEVMVNKTPTAYQNLIDGRVDLIFVLAPSEQQKNRAKIQGVELKLTPIGKEAFVFFVHAKNKVEGLSLQQIKDIYSGEVTNWSQVGGGSDAIRAFQRPQDSGSQTALQNLMDDTPIMDAPTENVAQGMGSIIEEVANYRNYKNAIGYTFRYYSNEMVQNKEIKLLEIDGVAPTKEMIRSNTYPITNEFYIVTTQNSNPKSQEIIDWMLSDEGQRLLENVGYVPIRELD
ncbi:substrate-binding domain-containing protein [Solibacillus sp. FSL R7-0682]|uniref:PstS family phosphate ABC transporter substrate-binding protein n=1 Tax=Solibacillus sp. FSL R7-0682 TaxID=2921690 RepID=UPI0030FBDE08